MKSAKEVYEIMKAHEEGAIIQYRNERYPDALWYDHDPKWLRWNWDSYDYRIKPKAPRDFELNCADGTFVRIYKEGEPVEFPRGKIVAREVIE